MESLAHKCFWLRLKEFDYGRNVDSKFRRNENLFKKNSVNGTFEGLHNEPYKKIVKIHTRNLDRKKDEVEK